jgi:hypothetical protein
MAYWSGWPRPSSCGIGSSNQLGEFPSASFSAEVAGLEGVVDGLEKPVALAAVVRDLKHGPTSWGSGRLRANIPHPPWQDQRVFDGLAWPPSAARRLKTSLRLTSSAAPIIVVSSAAAEGL